MVGPAIVLVPVAIYAGKKIVDYLLKAMCPHCENNNTKKLKDSIHYCINCNIMFDTQK